MHTGTEELQGPAELPVGALRIQQVSADRVGQQLRKTSLVAAPNPISTGRTRGDLCSLPKTQLRLEEYPGLAAPGCGKAPRLELQADATNSCWLMPEAVFCKLQS